MLGILHHPEVLEIISPPFQVVIITVVDNNLYEKVD